MIVGQFDQNFGRYRMLTVFISGVSLLAYIQIISQLLLG